MRKFFAFNRSEVVRRAIQLCYDDLYYNNSKFVNFLVRENEEHIKRIELGDLLK